LERRFVVKRSIAVVLAGAVALGGCASRQERLPSLKDTQSPAPAKEALDCGGRHLDREAGRPPAGATTLEQKQADDRLCGEEYRNSGYPSRN
jgi:hypothetical protein